VYTFASSTTTVGTLWTKDPRLVPLANDAMVVVAFMPTGAVVPPPPAANINAMLHPTDVPSATATTTTVPGATTTTVPTTATTTVPAATTTVPAATTTTAPTATTTTVAPATTSTTK